MFYPPDPYHILMQDIKNNHHAHIHALYNFYHGSLNLNRPFPGDALLRTPLLLAMETGHIECSEALLKLGASPEICDEYFGRPGLIHAIFENDLEHIKLFLKYNANINGQDREGETPLTIAAYFNRKEIFEYLLEQSPDPFIKNNRGETAMDILKSQKGTDDLIKRLKKYKTRLKLRHSEAFKAATLKRNLKKAHKGRNKQRPKRRPPHNIKK